MKVQFYVTDILLVDIVGFSTLSTKDQYKTAIVMTQNLKETVSILTGQSFREEREVILGFIPTGDGFYVLLHPEMAGYGLFLGLSLRSSILLASKRAGNLFKGVRVSVHLGETVPFRDITGQENYIGDGLNDAARLLKAQTSQSPDVGIPTDDNFIIISEEAYAQFEKAYPATLQMKQFLQTIQYKRGNLFEIIDKHGKTHRACFVECSRFVAVKPLPPPDLHERLKRIAENSCS